MELWISRLGFRLTWFTTLMTERATFRWPNCERLLLAKGEDQYEWVDHRSDEVKEEDGGGGGKGSVRGIVGCGDALDVVDALAVDQRILGKQVRLVYIDPPFGAQKRFGHYKDTL